MIYSKNSNVPLWDMSGPSCTINIKYGTRQVYHVLSRDMTEEHHGGNFSDFIAICRSGWYELKSDEYNALRLQFATLDMTSQIVISITDNRILTKKAE